MKQENKGHTKVYLRSVRQVWVITFVTCWYRSKKKIIDYLVVVRCPSVVKADSLAVWPAEQVSSLGLIL